MTKLRQALVPPDLKTVVMGLDQEHVAMLNSERLPKLLGRSRCATDRILRMIRVGLGNLPSGVYVFCFCVAHNFAFANAYAGESKEQAHQTTTRYVALKGDTLYDIAAHYLRHYSDWKVLARINHLNAPDRLSPGVVLLMPLGLLRQDWPGARVAATSGTAEHAYGDGPYTPLIVGMKLTEGDRIRTGYGGFATLELDDGSHISIVPNTSLELSRLSMTVLTRATDNVFVLQNGEVENEVTHARSNDSRFEIRSPSVAAGVRGTRFRIRHVSDTQVSAVEVLAGAVAVAPASEAQSEPRPLLSSSAQIITANFGSVTRAGAPVGKPVALLGEPSLAEPAKIVGGAKIVFDLVPLAGARAYRLQIARDAELLNLVRDERVRSPHASFGGLPDGTYFVRISALDSNGLEGLPRVYSFELQHLKPSTE